MSRGSDAAFVIASDLSAVARRAKAEAKQSSFCFNEVSWIASSLALLAMTAVGPTLSPTIAPRQAEGGLATA
jgi:hypothetical protein